MARERCAHCSTYVHRDFNKRADAFATAAVISFGNVRMGQWRPGTRLKFVRIWFDTGGRREGVMGSGVWLEVADTWNEITGMSNWVFVCGFVISAV